MTINKRSLIAAILHQLTAELSVITQAAKAAHDAATHEESKAEDQHDTRGVEAAYLAGAQASRAAELNRLVAFFKFLPVRDFGSGAVIDLGALVECSLRGRKSLYFLVQDGGGVTVSLDGRTISVITPRAPLGEALLGKISGDIAEVDSQGDIREWEILSVI